MDARWARKVENVSALVAYAVGPEGHRRLLAVTLGAEESQQSWSELLEQLQDRGLGGVELVIADEHAGLAAAVRRFLPEARRQRCTVHLQRNVGARVPHRLRKRVAREVSVIFQTSGLAEAKKLLGEFGARWKKELPEAVEVLERGFGAATQFYAFPEAHWPRLRTTNSLERLHGEIKRRIKAAGAFPDRASALRLITAVALRTTHVWGDRRYLDRPSSSHVTPPETGGRPSSLAEGEELPPLLHTNRDLRTGHVIHACMPRHRHQEFLRFIKTVERSVDPDLEIHVILDNYATHKHEKVRNWLARNPRVHFHFVPTGASWANIVERLFGELDERQLKRLAVNSVSQLIHAINTYLDHRNEDPTPFVWTKSARLPRSSQEMSSGHNPHKDRPWAKDFGSTTLVCRSTEVGSKSACVSTVFCLTRAEAV